MKNTAAAYSLWEVRQPTCEDHGYQRTTKIHETSSVAMSPYDPPRRMAGCSSPPAESRIHQSIIEEPESREKHLKMVLSMFPGTQLDREKFNIPRQEQWAEIPASDYERVAWRIIEALEQRDLSFNTRPDYYMSFGLLARQNVRTDYTLRRVRSEIDELAGQVSSLLPEQAAIEMSRGHELETPLPEALRESYRIHWRSLSRLGLLIQLGEREDMERFHPFTEVENHSISADAAWFMERLEARLEGRHEPPPPGRTKKSFLPPDRYEELRRQYESGEMDEKMRDWWERYE